MTHATTKIAHLPGRAVLAVTGEDRATYLQGLVSNDMDQLAPGSALWTGLLTPQGKYLADFFVIADPDHERLLIDIDAGQAEMVAARLTRFKLRSKVAIAAIDLPVHVAWQGDPSLGAINARDTRLPDAGWRLIGGALANAGADEWTTHRLALGLPDAADMEPDKTLLLEAGFDELSGVSWTKGCYMGQELTARTRYRGLLKRRLVPVMVEGPLPPRGTPVLAEGADIGTIRTGQGVRALATIRLEALDKPLTCGEATLRPDLPSWMRLPETTPGGKAPAG